MIMIIVTFSNFWKESALRGIHPWMASAATAVSHGGQPTAFCSASTFRWTNPCRKLKDPLLFFELFFLILMLLLLFLSLSTFPLESKIVNPEWPLLEARIDSEISTIVGDGEYALATTFLELMQPIWSRRRWSRREKRRKWTMAIVGENFPYINTSNVVATLRTEELRIQGDEKNQKTWAFRIPTKTTTLFFVPPPLLLFLLVFFSLLPWFWVSSSLFYIIQCNPLGFPKRVCETHMEKW